MKRNENVKENMKKYLSRLRNEDHDELKKKQMDRISKSRENMRKDMEKHMIDLRSNLFIQINGLRSGRSLVTRHI